MTEVVEEIEAADVAPSKLRIPVKTGRIEDRVVELVVGGRLMTILDIVAAERGCAVEELILFREGESEPVAATVLVEVDYPHRRRHHVHHVGDVVVAVYYQSRDKSRPFRRNATVEDVLAWAIKAFDVDPGMASEFELTLHGQKDELPGTEHIGHLAGRHKELALDLVRGDIANGADS